MPNQNETPGLIANKLKPFLVKIEINLTIIILVGVYLKTISSLTGGVILNISMGCLAIMYFFMAFAAPEPETLGIKIFLNKLTYWGCSVGVLGCLFRLQNFNGHNQLLIVGCGTLISALFFSVAKKQYPGRKTLIRILIILVVGVSLYFVPKEKLTEYKILPQVENTSNG